MIVIVPVWVIILMLVEVLRLPFQSVILDEGLGGGKEVLIQLLISDEVDAAHYHLFMSVIRTHKVFDVFFIGMVHQVKQRHHSDVSR